MHCRLSWWTWLLWLAALSLSISVCLCLTLSGALKHGWTVILSGRQGCDRWALWAGESHTKDEWPITQQHWTLRSTSSAHCLSMSVPELFEPSCPWTLLCSDHRERGLGLFMRSSDHLNLPFVEEVMRISNLLLAYTLLQRVIIIQLVVLAVLLLHLVSSAACGSVWERLMVKQTSLQNQYFYSLPLFSISRSFISPPLSLSLSQVDVVVLTVGETYQWEYITQYITHLRKCI